MLTYTDDSPYNGKTNYYTVRGYYSKTKVYGSYTNGRFLFVPEIETEPEPTPEPGNPTPTPVPEDPEDPEEPEINVYQWAQEVFELTNQERIKDGCQPLQYNQRLQDVGMTRAQEISIYFAHYHPNGDPIDYPENIAATGSSTASPERAIQLWMNSSGHRATIMNPNYKYMGVGVYKVNNGSVYWVQIFTEYDPDKTVTITFNPNGGTCSQTTMVVPYKSTIYQKDLPIPTRDGYTFKGWSLYGGIFKSAVVDDNYAFKAEWE